MPQNLNQTSKQILVDLINDANATAYVPADLIISEPSDWLTDDGQYDTTAMVNKIAYPEVENSTPVYYKRLDLGEVFSGKVVEIEFVNSINSIAEVLPYINSRYGFAMSTIDFDDTAINTSGAFPVAVIIKARADSLVYKGQFSIDLTREAPVVSGDTITANTTLTGGFVDGASKLLSDATVTATNFVKSVNANLTLALRARGAIAGPVAPAATGDYKIAEVSPIGGNWNVDIAISSNIAGGRMEAQYNFQLGFESDNDAIVFPLVLGYAAGVYTLHNDAYGVSLPAGYAAVDGSLVEFTIDMSDLATQNGFSQVLERAVINDALSPSGVFDVTLTATSIADSAVKHYVKLTADTSGV